jgi:outer membrane protein insertion porin family
MQFNQRVHRTGRGKILAAALIASVSFAQATQAQNFTLGGISVVGNKRIETSTIQTYAGLERGQSVSMGDLNAAYQRILDSGLFETVEMTPRGNQVVIEVKEYPTINRINFEGNQRLGDEVLSSLVQSRPRLVFNPKTAEADRAAIAKAYADSGRLAAKITPKIIRQSDNRVDLVFEVFEGGIVEIAKIGFVGNKSYSDRRLRRVLGTKQAGFFRTFVKSDTFIADRIEFDKQVLTDFYQSRGYVDFRVNNVNAELAQEKDAYFLNFNIREGQQFKFGSVRVTSDLRDVDAADFQSALILDSGDIYSPVALETNISRLERKAMLDGLDFVRVTPRVTRNDRDLTLDVDFVLERGERIFVERIDISGNTSTLDRVIRRQFRVAEGDPFNPREIRAAAERIRALGYFGTSDVNAREGSSPEQVVVDVKVSEEPTGNLSFGATYSVSSGAGLLLEYSERNFLGRGQQLNFAINSGVDNRLYELKFAEPAFLHDDLHFGLDLSFKETDNQNAAYDTRVARFQPGLTFPISVASKLSVRTTAEYSELSDAGTVGGVIDADVERGRVNNVSLGYTYTYDTRLTALDSKAGVLFQIGQDFGGLDGGDRHIQTTGRVIAQNKVWNEELTLRATVEAGLLSYQTGASRVTDRFFLGPSKLRGFYPAGVGPREVDGAINDALGGERFAVARLEAEFPIGLPEEYGISGGVFYDIGNLWSSGASDEHIEYDDGAWRHVVGASIFWNTPIGPLRFNFTNAIKKQSLDEEQTFDLTFATGF